MQNSLTNTFLKGMNLDTAKEFVGTELYTYAQNVHVVSTDGISGAMLPYIDVKTLTYPQDMGISETDLVLGTTDGYIQYNNDKTKCFIVLYKTKSDGDLTDLYGLSVYVESTRVFHIETSTFGFEGNVKLINVWENSEVSRVYMCGKDSYIQVVNINGEYPEDVDNYDFSIFPRCGALQPFVFNLTIKGNKMAGKVQYAYQLFDTNGRTTALSAISSMIPIGSELLGDRTNEGVGVKVTNLPNEYQYLRLFSIRYVNFSDLPRVYIKDEIPLDGTGFVVYEDRDDNYLSEYTIDEFLTIKSVLFKASTIEIAKNRLFAANVSENIWDIDFDARVYKSDLTGTVKLTLASGDKIECSLTDIVNGTVIVPNYAMQDNTDSETYKYNACYTKTDGTYPEGGAGPNVSYMFIRPVLYLAPNTTGEHRDEPNDQVYYNILSDDTSLNSFEDVSEIRILSDTVNGKEWETINVIQKSDVAHTIKDITYKDTYICSNYTGFKQGEYYTFGIIFYNKSHIPSPVHHIGTIQIPYFENWIYGGVEGKDNTYHDLLATTVGIRFKINIPEEYKSQIAAYEIVRATHTIDTRHVLYQGIISKALRYDETQPGGGTSLGAQDTRCPLYPTIGYNFSNLYTYDSFISGNTSTLKNELIFVSPEVSINKENIEQTVNLNKQIRIRNRLSSLIYDNRDLNEFLDATKGPYFEHVKFMTVYGTSYKLDKTYYHEKLAGIPFIKKVDDFFNTYDYYGISAAKEDVIGFGLFKYYMSSPTDNVFDVKSSAFCNVLPANNLGGSSMYSGVISNDKTFVNVTISSVLSQSRLGVHCPCLYLSINYNDELLSDQGTFNTRFNWNDTTFLYIDADPIYNAADSPSKSFKKTDHGWSYLSLTTNILAKSARSTVALADMCSAYIPNHSYIELTLLSYVSTGQYVAVNADQKVSYINCFGGDTYVCIHKELWAGFGYDREYTSNSLQGKDCINIKYPVETRINLDRVTGPNFDTNMSNPMLTFEPGQLLEYGSQELPLNAYNDAYSAQEYNKVFVTKGAYDIEDQHIGNRIVASEVKSTGELSDSFLNFKIANYIDVDVDHGNITNLVKYNDRLYYLQSTAFGTVAVNERSLITDNNQAALLLGTGDVLTRYDNISTFDGSNVTNDPSIIISPSSMYWYDTNKKLICVFNQGGVNSLSKIKQVLSYAKDMTNVHSGYDTKNNEVWFSDDTNSLIYNEQLLAFTGFYTTPVRFAQIMADHSIGLTKSNKLIQFGKTTDSTELSECFVKFVVNKEPALPKVFDTMMVTDCGSITPDGVIPFDVDCTTTRQGDSYGNCVHNREGIYYVSIGRDLNKERMRDKTMTVLLTFKDTNFNVPFVNTIYRYSRI